MTPPLIQALPDRLAAIVAGICAALAVRAARDRAMAPLGLLLWRRLVRLVARFRAAVVRSELPSRPAVARPAASRANRKPAQKYPRGFAAMVRLVPAAAAFGSQLQALLGEPEMRELLANSPQARRTLRPLCQMLGIRPDPALFPPPASRPVPPPITTPTPEPASPQNDHNSAGPPMPREPELADGAPAWPPALRPT